MITNKTILQQIRNLGHKTSTNTFQNPNSNETENEEQTRLHSIRILDEQFFVFRMTHVGPLLITFTCHSSNSCKLKILRNETIDCPSNLVVYVKTNGHNHNQAQTHAFVRSVDKTVIYFTPQTLQT